MIKVKLSLFAKTAIALASFFIIFSFLPNPLQAADENPGFGYTVGPPVVEYTAERGQTVNGVVKVNDYSPIEVTLYPQVADFAAKDETGQPTFYDANPNSKYSLSSWIKFSEEPVIFAIGELKAIPYQIVVPEDAEPGGHYGVLFFSTKSPNNVKEGEAKVVANMKVGQLILVTVPGEIKTEGIVETFKTKHFWNFFPQVKYSNEKFFNFSHNIDFITRIQNVGNVHFKPAGKIEIKNLFGQKVGSEVVNEIKGNILPDSTRKFDNTWKAKWYQFGYFKANLDLSYGTPEQSFQDRTGFLIIPWWLIIIVILVILLLWRMLAKKKKRKKEQLNNKS